MQVNSLNHSRECPYIYAGAKEIHVSIYTEASLLLAAETTKEVVSSCPWVIASLAHIREIASGNCREGDIFRRRSLLVYTNRSRCTRTPTYIYIYTMWARVRWLASASARAHDFEGCVHREDRMLAASLYLVHVSASPSLSAPLPEITRPPPPPLPCCRENERICMPCLRVRLNVHIYVHVYRYVWWSQGGAYYTGVYLGLRSRL